MNRWNLLLHSVLCLASMPAVAVAQPFGGSSLFSELPYIEDPAVQRDRQWLHHYLADKPAYKSGTLSAQIDRMTPAQIRHLTRYYQTKHDLEVKRETASEIAGYASSGFDPSTASPGFNDLGVLQDAQAFRQRDIEGYDNQIANLAEVRRWRFQVARQAAALRPTFHADSYQPFIFNPLLYDYSLYYMDSSADGYGPLY